MLTDNATLNRVIANLESVGFTAQKNELGGIEFTHNNVDGPVNLSTAVIIMRDLLKDLKEGNLNV